ncbi:hypothetical protein BSA16_03215 [Micromonospora sp. Rc5]|nr:hypothetical protein BSA16_03215 [Micromonospora sp. Rc5]
MILGDPGAGKSTLTAKLVQDLATDRIPGLSGQVPILLTVRSHTHSLRTDHHTLLHYLEASCRNPHNLIPPRDGLEYLLLNGRATVIIDGVDELGEASFRMTFTQLVESFARHYPLTRVIVTSRIIGYADARLDPDLFPVATIAPFSQSQILHYASRWFRLDSTLSTEERSELTRSFFQESSAAGDLRSNPLLLSLLCSLYASAGFIPRNKPEIYEKCAELLFETWDRSRGMAPTRRYSAHIKPAIQRLAWLILTDAKHRQALPRSELVDFLVEYMQTKRFEDADEARQAAEDFLRFCAGRAWVLTDTGSDALQPHYGFVHRTFLEYFAATQLVKRDPSPETVWSQLEAKIADPSWHVVSQLCIQLVDRQVEEGSERVLQQLISTADSSNDIRKKSLLLSFAAQSLNFVAPDNRTLRRLVSKCVQLSCAATLQQRQTTSDRPYVTGNVLPGNDSFILHDAPLEMLCRVGSSDNTARVASCVAEYVYQTALEEHQSPAGLTHFFLSHTNTFASESEVSSIISDELSKRAIPPSAKLWRRLVLQPSPDDLRANGMNLLYHLTLFGNRATPSVMNTLLAALFNAEEQSSPHLDLIEWPAYLDDIYDEAVQQHRSTNANKPSVLQNRQRVRLEISRLMQITPRARGSLLLLLLPIAESTVIVSDNLPELQLFPARISSHARGTALPVLSSLSLPAEANDLLVEWFQED